jgi:D5 N terminal like/Primase C terminal 1 (PriCT-1)
LSPRTRNVLASQLDEIEKFVARTSLTGDTYMGVASRLGETGGGSFANCAELMAIFAEIDFKDSDEETARQRVAAFPLWPSIVIRSGGGLHCYYLLDDPLDLQNGGQPIASRLPRALARVLGGDLKSAEPARVLRLPGTLNHKYQPAREVKIEHFDARQRYSIDQIESAISNVPSVEQRRVAEALPDTILEGGRNNTLFVEGCRLRRMGWQEKEIADALLTLNRERATPPLEVHEVQAIAHSVIRFSSAEDMFPLTDAGNAEAFVAKFARRLRFDHARARWVVFGSHHWEIDGDGQVHRCVLEGLRERQVTAANSQSESRTEQLKWLIKTSESATRLGACLNLAQSLRPVATSGDEWDQDPWLFGVANGVIDCRTGTFRAGQPSDWITLVAPVSYDSHAECPRWTKFLNEIFADDPDLPGYFQRVVGYCLTGVTSEQVFWILYGTGANGKSTLIETLQRTLFGPYAATMPFPSAHWSDAITDYQKAALVARRFVTASEVTRQGRLHEEMIKSLTGGTRSVPAIRTVAHSTSCRWRSSFCG